MGRRRWLVRAFPRAWRARFGDELEHLLSDMEHETGRIGAKDRLDVARAGLTERLSTLGRHRRALVRFGVAISLGAAGTFATLEIASSPTAQVLHPPTASPTTTTTPTTMTAHSAVSPRAPNQTAQRNAASRAAARRAAAHAQAGAAAARAAAERALARARAGANPQKIGPGTPPPQRTTLGAEVSVQHVLAVTESQVAGVARLWFVRTTTYASVARAFTSSGAPPVQSTSDPTWTPVPNADPVDVVTLSGALHLPTGHPCAWVARVVNPTNAEEIMQACGPSGPGGQWPSYFNTLPPYRSST